MAQYILGLDIQSMSLLSIKLRNGVEYNADFVFFSIQKKVFYLHISSRTVKKVYELAQRESLSGVSPFKMVWPPTFLTLNGGHDNDE